MSNLIELLNEELSAAVDSARRSLVQVHVAGRHGRANGAGAGTIIHPDGLIITNAHVVRRQSPAIVLWDGRELDGRLLAYDEDVDLAAVSVEAHRSARPAAAQRLARADRPVGGRSRPSLGRDRGIHGRDGHRRRPAGGAAALQGRSDPGRAALCGRATPAGRCWTARATWSASTP
jgi:hypothetical protein